jgi:hypothetical protein
MNIPGINFLSEIFSTLTNLILRMLSVADMIRSYYSCFICLYLC